MVGWDIEEESERRRVTQFLSIDQVRGHLTPDLLGRTLRQLLIGTKGQLIDQTRGHLTPGLL